MTPEQMDQHSQAIGALLLDRDMSLSDAFTSLGYVLSEIMRACPPDIRLELAKRFSDLLVHDVRSSLS